MEEFAKVILIIIAFIVITYIYALKKQGKYQFRTRTRRRKYYRKRYYDYRTADQKGEEGEFFVKNIIGGTIPGEQYLINNIIISDNGKTSQIDHIVINTNGIYVIETKNYSGRIYGYEHQMKWTQVLNKNTINHFYNPLKQNATHVYYLKKTLTTKIPIYSMVVFTNDNIENIHASHVVTLEGLRNEIHKPSGNFTISEMEDAFTQIKKIKSENNVTETEHIKNIRKTINDIENNICPRCGTRLIKKNGKYGEFWGCARYPDCKFTKK